MSAEEKNHPHSSCNDLEEGLLSSTLPPSPPKLISTKSEPTYSASSSGNHNSLPLRSNSVTRNSITNHSSNRSKSASEIPKQQSIWQTAFSSLPLPLPITRQASIPVFYCQICFENHPQVDSFQSIQCPSQHQYCRESMKTLIESWVTDGRIMIRCPGYDECSGILTDNEIQSLISDTIWNKYLRYKDMKQNPNYRECPFCSHSTLGEESFPEITCEQCHQKYCYWHANAHGNQSCQQYTREQLKTQLKSLAMIKTTTRNCPQCGAATEKNGGCNHMTCHQCHTNWCWLCGRVMGDNHFDDAIGGCAGGQFADAPAFALWTVFPCLRWSLWFYLSRIPVIIFLFCLMVYGFVLGLISAAFACACLPLSAPILGLMQLDCFDSDMGTEFLTFPGIAFFGFVSSICLMIIEILWLPFAFVMSLILIPFQCLTGMPEDNDENSMPYWKCCSRCNFSPFWCFPIFSITNLVKGVTNANDD